MTRAWVIFVTVPNRKEADRMSKILIQEKLAACVSILGGMSSCYRWKGKLELAKENLLLIKTTPNRYKALEKRIHAIHSYSVPEILAMPVVEGNPAYLQWLKNSV